jgi:hypothetical protein
MNEFKKNKYKVVKNIISKELTDFIYNYFLLKRNVVSFYLNSNLIPKDTLFIGKYNDPQVDNTYSEYSDFCMETLLKFLKPILENEINLQLIETYSFARIYKNGDVLKKHKDRPSCEISTTLNLGGEQWPIYLRQDNSEIEIVLNPSDVLIYKGCEVEHWRNKFEGNICAQVFLHYNDINGPYKLNNKYDNRFFLGCQNI